MNGAQLAGVTGAEFDRRVRVAIHSKWGDIWGLDLETNVPSSVMPLSIRDLIDNVVADCSMLFNGLVPISAYEDPSRGVG